jgi:hypothetical protein
MNLRFGVILDAPADGTTVAGNKLVDNDKYGIIVQNAGANAPDPQDNMFEGSKPTFDVLDAGDIPYGVQDIEFN